MGDPDLIPIASYESTILVRMFYQIASRLNEIVSTSCIYLTVSKIGNTIRFNLPSEIVNCRKIFKLSTVPD